LLVVLAFVAVACAVCDECSLRPTHVQDSRASKVTFHERGAGCGSSILDTGTSLVPDHTSSYSCHYTDGSGATYNEYFVEAAVTAGSVVDCNTITWGSVTNTQGTSVAPVTLTINVWDGDMAAYIAGTATLAGTGTATVPLDDSVSNSAITYSISGGVPICSGSVLWQLISPDQTGTYNEIWPGYNTAGTETWYLFAPDCGLDPPSNVDASTHILIALDGSISTCGGPSPTPNSTPSVSHRTHTGTRTRSHRTHTPSRTKTRSRSHH